MDKLQGYQDDKASQGNKASFLKWELCALEIGYELLFRCIDSRLNIVFDHSGSRSDHVELLIHLKRKEGYRIKVVALLIDKALAAKRAAGRDRYLPPEYIPERKKILDGLRPLYQAIADEYTMYKATSSGTVLLNQPMEHKKKYPDKKM